VLGVGAWTPDKSADQEKARNHHAAFVALLGRAAAETGDPDLQACVLFFANEVEVQRAREALKAAKPGTLLALAVGEPLVYSAVVQEFWRRHYQLAFGERNAGTTGECLISGKSGPIAPTHDKIKGLSSLGGQASGVALMSFDKEAFRSYGWEQNENSPVCPDRAQAYVLALNDLLRQGKKVPSRRDIAGIGFIFWTRHKDDFNLWQELDPQPGEPPLEEEEADEPSTDAVDKLLKFDTYYTPAENDFYLAGVSGNGGRLRVRYWVTETLAQVRANLQQWQEQLRVAYPWDDPGPVRIWQLGYVLDRDGEPPAHQTLALLRRAIEGRRQPLGYGMLSAALSRLRHPEEDAKGSDGKRKDPMRLSRLRIPIGLIRLCLNDIQPKGVPEMKEGLDPDCALPAYICGRLMAEYENLQREAHKRDRKDEGEVSSPHKNDRKGGSEVNSSVLDRYFTLASTYPAAAFPKMNGLAQNHLRKLRRDKPGAHWAIQDHLQELHAKLQPAEAGPYPGKLSLEGQGLFALGYYHQKAASIPQATDRKKSNASDNETASQENA
jgi:CRISPR-associated protein Csd1